MEVSGSGVHSWALVEEEGEPCWCGWVRVSVVSEGVRDVVCGSP